VNDGHPESYVPMARGAAECNARYDHPMAAKGISAVLALEIEAERTTATLAKDLQKLIREMAAENSSWARSESPTS
jgi:hypothetical protein